MSIVAYEAAVLLLVLLLPIFIAVVALSLMKREKERKKRKSYDYRELLVDEMDLYAQLWFYHNKGRKREMVSLLKRVGDRETLGYYASRLLEKLRRTR